MAIKFQDKKAGDAAAKPRKAPKDTEAEHPGPAAAAPEPPSTTSDPTPELPFAKPVRPEKKSRRK